MILRSHCAEKVGGWTDPAHSCAQPDLLSIKNPVESSRESSRMLHPVKTTTMPKGKPLTSSKNMDCIRHKNKSLRCWINSKLESTLTQAAQMTKEKEEMRGKDPRDNTRNFMKMNLGLNKGKKTQDETESVVTN